MQHVGYNQFLPKSAHFFSGLQFRKTQFVRDISGGVTLAIPGSALRSTESSSINVCTVIRFDIVIDVANGDSVKGC